jgi:hypothetical protein
MRKIIMLVGIVAVAAIAIAWSTSDRHSGASNPSAEAAATLQPNDIMRTIGRQLPTEAWDDLF